MNELIYSAAATVDSNKQLRKLTGVLSKRDETFSELHKYFSIGDMVKVNIYETNHSNQIIIGQAPDIDKLPMSCQVKEFNSMLNDIINLL